MTLNLEQTAIPALCGLGGFVGGIGGFPQSRKGRKGRAKSEKRMHGKIVKTSRNAAI